MRSDMTSLPFMGFHVIEQYLLSYRLSDLLDDLEASCTCGVSSQCCQGLGVRSIALWEGGVTELGIGPLHFSNTVLYLSLIHI